MLSRLFRFTGPLLHGPATLCAGLFTFLVILLLVLNRLIFVDASGHNLHPGNVNIRPMGPITRELIELTRDDNWAKKPEKRARVFMLNEMLEKPDGIDSQVLTPVPYRFPRR